MTMKLLVARRSARGVRFVVHLDTTKMLPDGTTPDPAWTFEQRWIAPRRGDAETGASYTARLAAWTSGVRADLKETALARLADVQEQIDPGTALPQEGQTF